MLSCRVPSSTLPFTGGRTDLDILLTKARNQLVPIVLLGTIALTLGAVAFSWTDWRSGATEALSLTATPSSRPAVRRSEAPTRTPVGRTPTPTRTLAPPTPTATEATSGTVYLPLQMDDVSTSTPTPMPTPSPTATATPIPLPTPDGVRREARVPILMYHYVSEPPSAADPYRRDLTIQPPRFEEHLRYLKEAGYQSISLRDLIFHLQRGEPLPEKPVIITFDDGYADNFQNAFPLLQEYGFTATFFILTGFVDGGYQAYMTWDEIVALHRAGMEIGAHSRDHPDLRGKPLDYLVWQILGPKQAIEAHVGVTPRFFSYPSGKHDGQAIDVLRSAHFWGAVTVEQGASQSSDRTFRLQRIRVRGDYDAADLERVIEHWTSG